MNMSNGKETQTSIPQGARLMALKRGQHACRDGGTAYTVRLLCVVPGSAYIVTGEAARLLGCELNPLTETLTTPYTEDELIRRLSRKLFGCPDSLGNARSA